MTAQLVRSVLEALTRSPEALLRNAEGRNACAVMVDTLMPRVLSAARDLGLGPDWCGRNEVINTTIVGLCEKRGRVARLALDSRDPMAYVAECLLSWMREQWGSRSASLQAVQEQFADRRAAVTSDEGYTDIQDVVVITHRWLAPRTPSRLQQHLPDLLRWLAYNPPQRRSYEAVDLAAAQDRFADFTPGQIRAVAGIAWGTRPNHQDSSLMGAVLLNTAFRPSDSLTHTRALLHFTRTMRAEEQRWLFERRLVA